MTVLRIPSKTFLLGEYAILQGSSAILIGHGPHFESSFKPGSGSPFHAESPAGRWLKEHPISSAISFRDPFEGRGGFGGSGAEFLTAWAGDNEDIPSPESPRAIFAWNAWEDSRTFPGSGADILTQAFGLNREHPFFLKVDIAGRSLSEIYLSSVKHGTISLFHTGRKVATHEQKTPTNLPIEELNEIVELAELHLESGLLEGLAGDINTYGKKMEELGLVAPHTLAALQTLPKDVLAAKGCGAMGSDVILVLHRGASLEDWGSANSLALVGNIPV